MGNLKNTISNKYYLKKKKPSPLISYKKKQKSIEREREREREYGWIGIIDGGEEENKIGEMISNL